MVRQRQRQECTPPCLMRDASQAAHAARRRRRLIFSQKHNNMPCRMMWVIQRRALAMPGSVKGLEQRVRSVAARARATDSACAASARCTRQKGKLIDRYSATDYHATTPSRRAHATKQSAPPRKRAAPAWAKACRQRARAPTTDYYADDTRQPVSARCKRRDIFSHKIGPRINKYHVTFDHHYVGTSHTLREIEVDIEKRQRYSAARAAPRAPGIRSFSYVLGKSACR